MQSLVMFLCTDLSDPWSLKGCMEAHENGIASPSIDG